MSVMAKKKSDRHISAKAFRVERDVHTAFQLLALRNDRPMSREVRAAHVRYLKEHGAWPMTPEMERELKRLQGERQP
jgi:hypothetical protein